MTLDTLAVLRSDEALAAGAWRYPDPDEADAEPECEVCHGSMRVWQRHSWAGGTYLRHPSPGQRLCHGCTDLGWRSAPRMACRCCGGLTKTFDWGRRRGHLTGWCARCRAAEHQQRELA